jgi:hypothetical protein|tara:strand:- start:7 stop:174 length:168 start_codon:yes stop_codon:yes gene_type:complete
MVAGLIIRGIGIAAKGVGKALKASKRKARRKRLGLPGETNSQRMKRIKKTRKRSK